VLTSKPQINLPSEEWKTRQELEVITGMKRFKLMTRLHEGMASGKVEMRKFPKKMITGSVRHEPFYRIKENV
jgi:hypothetical protein